MAMHKVAVNVKTARKTGQTNFFKPGPLFLKILVWVGLIFLSLVPDQNFCENFGLRPRFFGQAGRRNSAKFLNYIPDEIFKFSLCLTNVQCYYRRTNASFA